MLVVGVVALLTNVDAFVPHFMHRAAYTRFSSWGNRFNVGQIEHSQIINVAPAPSFPVSLWLQEQALDSTYNPKLFYKLTQAKSMVEAIPAHGDKKIA